MAAIRGYHQATALRATGTSPSRTASFSSNTTVAANRNHHRATALRATGVAPWQMRSLRPLPCLRARVGGLQIAQPRQPLGDSLPMAKRQPCGQLAPSLRRRLPLELHSGTSQLGLPPGDSLAENGLLRNLPFRAAKRQRLTMATTERQLCERLALHLGERAPCGHCFACAQGLVSLRGIAAKASTGRRLRAQPSDNLWLLRRRLRLQATQRRPPTRAATGQQLCEQPRQPPGDSFKADDDFTDNWLFTLARATSSGSASGAIDWSDSSVTALRATGSSPSQTPTFLRGAAVVANQGDHGQQLCKPLGTHFYGRASSSSRATATAWHLASVSDAVVFTPCCIFGGSWLPQPGGRALSQATQRLNVGGAGVRHRNHCPTRSVAGAALAP